MTPRRMLVALAAPLSVAASACDGAPGSTASAVEVRDSAGVRISRHSDGMRVDTVAPTPLLSIGREGEPDYEFFSVRAVSVLASGNVVVANGGTSELLFYGPDGRFVRRVGRQGDGPAEFGFLTTVYTRAGDTLVVMDPRRRRLLHFDSAGVFVRGASFAEDLTTATPTTTCVFPGLVGLLANGTRVTRGWGCIPLQGSDGRRPTQTTLELVDGARHDTIGEYDLNTVWERGSQAGGPGAFSIIPFESVVSWETWADRVYLSDGRAFEVRIFEDRGTLSGILREDQALEPVSDDDARIHLEQRIADDFPLPDGVPIAETFGAYQRLVASHEGELWAQWVDRPSQPTVRWTVYSADGASARGVVIPRMTVRAIRGGRVYAAMENELGIQTIVVFQDPGARH